MSAIFQGAAQGAMAGSALGPWGMAGGAIIGGISGLLGGRSAKKQRQEAERQDQERRAAYGWAAGEYNRLGNEYGEDAKFVPQGVRTQFGRSFQDPETGEMVSELDPRYTQMRDQWGSIFDQEFDRLQGFDAEKLASDRYGMLQRLVAGDRAQKTDSTMGMLLRRGLIGSAANDGTGRVTNPFMSSLQRSFADEDTKMALSSMDWADQRRRDGLGLLSGFQSNIMGIDSRGDNLLQQSYGWSGMMNQHNLQALDNQYGMFTSGIDAGLKGRLPAKFLMDMKNQETAGKYAGANEMVKGIGSFLPALGGLFGGGGGFGSNPGSPYDIRAGMEPLY